MTPKVILHIPHASTIIPPEVRPSLLLSDEALARELLRMTDRFTEELFDPEPSIATKVVFPVSRLVVDPERFRDDGDEPMAKRGMGVVYTRTSEGGDLRSFSYRPGRDALLKEYYDPHHQLLAATVRDSLGDNGACMILDCHSFSSVPLPHELDQRPQRPDVCIGTDLFHSPMDIVSQFVKAFEGEGFGVALNRPFEGALVPFEFLNTNPRVQSVMVEINRSLYMDEVTGLKRPDFDSVKAKLHGAMAKWIQRAQ